MAWVSPAFDIDAIIKQAAQMLGHQDVVQNRNDVRRLRYFDVLNKFISSLGNARNWWFLSREGSFATVDGQDSYDLRLQASATVTISGTVTATDKITIDGTDYAFVTGGSIALSTAELIALVNAGTQAYAVQTGTGVIELYWLGDDGDAKTLTNTEAGSVIATDATFTNSMPDFSKLTSIRIKDNFPIRRVNPLDVHELGYVKTDSQPVAYAMTGGESTLRLYSGSYGGPDDTYLMEIAYQAMPSAILPDGRGDIDIPVQFHDILPQAIKVIYLMDTYDQEAVFGDQYIQRRIAEMEAFHPDQTAEWEHESRLPLPRMAIDIRPSE